MYTTILWLGDSAWKKPEKFPLLVQRLKEMGINTGMVTGDQDPTPWRSAGMPYYVENIVNRGLCLKWNSKVADWDKFVTEWAKNGRPESAFVREYCLNDPAWRESASAQMRRAAGIHSEQNPLFDIRDEVSTTISANPFDYDFSPRSKAAFRVWLKSKYRNLRELNRQWQTSFARWDDVMPFSTDRIKNRMAGGGAAPRGAPDWQALQSVRFIRSLATRESLRWNLAPWCDFRSFMDSSFANTISDLRDATWDRFFGYQRAGIEGTQMPSAFGGYDLSKLAKALDWVEPYDIGGAREIWGSLLLTPPMRWTQRPKPGVLTLTSSFRKKPAILTTVGEQDARAARRRLWHLTLLGDTGCIVWWSEDCIDFNKDDWPLTPRALALTPVLQEMQGALAERFRSAEREQDPIFLHYSHPSIQVAWLIESTVDGSTWHRRFSSYEALHNRHAAARVAWLSALQDLGYSPQFTDHLDLAPHATLVLPDSWALSDEERDALSKRHFRRVLSSGEVGAFDGHGTLFPGPPPKTTAVPHDLRAYAAARLEPTLDSPLPAWLARQLPPPPVRVRAGDRVRVHRFRESGAIRLLAFERGIVYQMSESLQQAGGNQNLEKPVDVEAKLESPRKVVDLWTGKSLGKTDTLRFTLDPWRPSLFSVEGV